MSIKIVKLLKANKLNHIIPELQSLTLYERIIYAKALKMIDKNFDCFPNGGVISELIDFLEKESTSLFQ